MIRREREGTERQDKQAAGMSVVHRHLLPQLSSQDAEVIAMN